MYLFWIQALRKKFICRKSISKNLFARINFHECWSSQNKKFAVSLQCLKKELRDKNYFLHADKHQSFLQVDFNTLGLKVFFKVILSWLMDMIKHSQSTESNKFVISLQYIKKEFRDGIHFLHADKHQADIIVFDGSNQST